MSKGNVFGWVMVSTLALLGLVLLGANLQIGGCEHWSTEEDSKDYVEWSTNFDQYIFSGGKVVDVQFEPDKDGNGTTAELTTYVCTEQDADSCVLYEFDSDFDGVPDTHIIDGASAGQRGLSFLGIAGFLRITMSTANLTTEDPELWICASGT